MQRSEHRILTTHAGSLPRPAALTRLYAQRVRGEPTDPAEIEREGRAAVRAIVQKQIDTGLDVIDDGEQSRESFVLYMRHRLTGLGGERHAPDACRSRRLSAVQARVPARVTSRRPGVQPRAAAEGDRAGELCRPVRRSKPNAPTSAPRWRRCKGRYVEAFLTAPSPGIIASIVQNEHYDTFERYLDALGAALQVEYEAIVAAGFLLQLDCPDLALERHTSYRDRPLADFVGFVEARGRRDQQGAAQHSARQGAAARVLGQLRGPARPRRRAARHPAGDPARRRPGRSSCRSPIRAMRTSSACSAKLPLDDDQLLIAGVIDTLTNFVEHPEVVADRIERIAAVVGRERVLAATDCGFDTSAGMGRVAEDVVWAKLRALRDGAQLATKNLFKS